MPCRAKFVGLAGFVTLAVIVAALLFESREPYYQGRSLSNWLQDCSASVYESERSRSEADEAIQLIGAKRAIPVLLPMVQAQDGPMRAWAIQKQCQWNLSRIGLRDADEIQRFGIAGFRALGTNAATAVAGLQKLLQNPKVANAAIWALIYIGRPAADAVCSALTNQVVEIRCASALELSEVLDDFHGSLGKLAFPSPIRTAT
jgi:hypothetical protein